MPALRNFPELGGKTIGRRLNPLQIQNENAGLLEIDPLAFTKVNIDQFTVNDTLVTPLQGNQVMPVGVGTLGGSVYVLKAAALAGSPFVPGIFADLPAGAVDPENAVWAGVYVADEKLLGVVMHDLAGNRFDSVGGQDTELMANYYDGPATYMDLFVYETHERTELVAGDARAQATVGRHTNVPLVYTGGDRLFVDVRSGLLTNRVPKSLAVGVADISGAFDPATDVIDVDHPEFRPTRIINGVHPTPIAILLDVPTSEYRALRVKLLV